MAENKNIAVMDSNREALYAPPIKELIYEVREQYVMIDRDLSVLYQVETGYLNRQVKRNRERFPSDFMFQLTREEYQFLKCQNGISRTWGGDHRAFPYAFTQNGIAMLSSVLRSPAAKDISQQLSLDLQRHNAQYPAIVVEQFNRSHDRFLLIDDEVYHVGASLKDLGKKWFAIMKMTTITATQLLSNI